MSHSLSIFSQLPSTAVQTILKEELNPSLEKMSKAEWEKLVKKYFFDASVPAIQSVASLRSLVEQVKEKKVNDLKFLLYDIVHFNGLVFGGDDVDIQYDCFSKALTKAYSQQLGQVITNWGNGMLKSIVQEHEHALQQAIDFVCKNGHVEFNIPLDQGTIVTREKAERLISVLERAEKEPQPFTLTVTGVPISQENRLLFEKINTLIENNKISELNLSANDLDDDAAKALAASIQIAKSRIQSQGKTNPLKLIDLRRNHIKESGAQLLSAAAGDKVIF